MGSGYRTPARHALHALAATVASGLLAAPSLHATAASGRQPPQVPPAAPQAGDDGATCSVTDFGARGDGVTNDAVAIAAAIRDCRLRSPSPQHITVTFPRGEAGGRRERVYLAGPFNLTSDLTLRVEAGVRLAASDVPDDYPIIPPLPSFGVGRDRFPKHSHAQYGAFIQGWNVSNVIVEGPGTIDGRGRAWWDRALNGTLLYTRPRVVEFMYGQDLTVRGVAVVDPPFWNVHFAYSRRVHVHHVDIRSPFDDAPNSDGVDLNSVSGALIEHSNFSVGDDAIAIKSGMDAAGVAFGMPSRDIHIRHVRVGSKCIAVGSEMSGGVSNVLVEDVTFGDDRPENSWHGVYVKSQRGRGGLVRNVTFRNLTSTGYERKTPFINVDMYYSGDIPVVEGYAPRIQDLAFQDIRIGDTRALGQFRGLPESPIDGVAMRDVVAVGNYSLAYTCMNVLDGVASADSPHFDFSECRNDKMVSLVALPMTVA